MIFVRRGEDTLRSRQVGINLPEHAVGFEAGCGSIAGRAPEWVSEGSD
jgi:hypothetical protein